MSQENVETIGAYNEAFNRLDGSAEENVEVVRQLV